MTNSFWKFNSFFFYKWGGGGHYYMKNTKNKCLVSASPLNCLIRNSSLSMRNLYLSIYIKKIKTIPYIRRNTIVLRFYGMFQIL